MHTTATIIFQTIARPCSHSDRPVRLIFFIVWVVCMAFSAPFLFVFVWKMNTTDTDALTIPPWLFSCRFFSLSANDTHEGIATEHFDPFVLMRKTCYSSIFFFRIRSTMIINFQLPFENKALKRCLVTFGGKFLELFFRHVSRLHLEIILLNYASSRSANPAEEEQLEQSFALIVRKLQNFFIHGNVKNYELEPT